MIWPVEIKSRAERLTVMLVLSTFTAYLGIFVLGATRYLA